MNNKGRKKISMLILLGFMALLSVFPSIMADPVILDGIVSEGAWLAWFDDPGSPSYDVSYSYDEDAIYIGMVLDSANIKDAKLQFAFRAKKCDFKIRITPDGEVSFNPGGPSQTSWWWGRRQGLPYGVDVVKSETDGKTSYEIKILKEILGGYTEIPDNFPFWVMFKVSNNALKNTYPDSRADWWFERGGVGDVPEGVPLFHAPEIPLGTISSIVVMAAALVLVSRKNNNIDFI